MAKTMGGERCSFCNYTLAHAEGCPGAVEGSDHRLAVADWHAGHIRGFCGSEMLPPAELEQRSPSYQLGYWQGETDKDYHYDCIRCGYSEVE